MEVCPQCGQPARLSKHGTCRFCEIELYIERTAQRTAQAFAQLSASQRSTYQRTESQRKGRANDPMPAPPSISPAASKVERMRAQEAYDTALYDWRVRAATRKYRADQKRLERMMEKVRKNDTASTNAQHLDTGGTLDARGRGAIHCSVSHHAPTNQDTESDTGNGAAMTAHGFTNSSAEKAYNHLAYLAGKVQAESEPGRLRDAYHKLQEAITEAFIDIDNNWARLAVSFSSSQQQRDEFRAMASPAVRVQDEITARERAASFLGDNPIATPEEFALAIARLSDASATI